MSLSDDLDTHHSGTQAWIGRRVRDVIVLTGGLMLALPLIVPFA